MCQLLGMSFNQDITPNFYFSALLSRSRQNPDGWGLACYPGECKSAVVFKEPVAGYQSTLTRFLCKYQELRSKIFVGHIRKATRGSLSYDNTHPFNRCYGGREFSFAHNGTLHRRKELNRLTYQPIGDTDSERAFCFLLSQLRRHEIKPVRAGELIGYTDTDFLLIHEILLDINARTAGKLNCIFSDGQHLFCYRDFQEARNLFWREVKCKRSNNETGKNFTTQFSYIEPPEIKKGYIIATEPLDNKKWHTFTAGHLMVFKDGEVVANLS